ncbi:MAG TPA: hypothetical protein VGM56_06015 [Byssovorax sp.]
MRTSAPAYTSPEHVDGAALEVVELDGEGFVTLRSLYAPFGKRVDNQVAQLETWATLRKIQVPSRKGAGNLPDPEPLCIAYRDAPLAIARTAVAAELGPQASP